jgi:dTDP-L-rhamnose 4-epimerase
LKYGKVLITGGLGFIGGHVAQQLVEQGRHVLLFDNLCPQIHGAVPEITMQGRLQHAQVEIYRGDVRSAADWEKVLPEASDVVHLAAETGTGQSMYEISRYTDTNVGGTATLLDYLANRRHNIRKVILASSRSVYGEGAYRCAQCGIVYPPMRTEDVLNSGHWDPQCPSCDGPITAVATPEDAKLAPASIYAATKLAQEHLLRIATGALGIPPVILRMQNVYGEGQSLKNPYTGILSIFSNQLRLGKALNLYEDGQESRDFVHVLDVARVVALALGSEAADGYTLNVGSGSATTIEDIALLLRDRFESKLSPIVSGRYRLGDIRHGLADLTVIRARLGFEPMVSLEDGLGRFAKWVNTQPVEPDQLIRATQELVERGLMPQAAAVTDQGMTSNPTFPILI